MFRRTVITGASGEQAFFPFRIGLRQDRRMPSRSRGARATRAARVATSPREGAESGDVAVGSDAGVVTTSAPPGATLVLAALILGLGLAHIVYLEFLYDDAFISFRYAKNLVAGLGLVFNSGERVEGYSNFLWTVLMALVIRVGGDPERWSLVLGALFELAALGVVLWAAHRRGLGLLTAGTLIAASSAWAAWGSGGLETSLFTLCITLGAVALMLGLDTAPGATPAGVADGRWFLASAVAFGLGALTRPDGLLPAGCAFLVVVVLAARGRIGWNAALAWSALLALCVVPHLLWRLSYYGRLVPNTYAVKQPGLSRFAYGATYLGRAAVDLHLELLVIPIGIAAFAGARHWRLRGLDLALIAAIVLPFAAYLTSTGGDFMPDYRFVAPLLPLASLAAAGGFDAIARVLSPGMPRLAVRVIPITIVMCYAAVNLVFSARQQTIWAKDEMVSVAWARQEVEDWKRIGRLLHTIALPTDTLATTAAGAVPYESGLYTIDMLGLNHPDLSRFRLLDSHRPGHTWLYKEAWVDADPPQILLAHPLVHATTASLGLSYAMRPEWRPRVLSHYQLLGLKLLGEPIRYVGVGVRNDVVDRLIEAGKRAEAAQPTE
jgi:4-amino-4-deoxy-L-arabinose transferase-like glycosyltransferase